jgi:hypothetical protein
MKNSLSSCAVLLSLLVGGQSFAATTKKVVKSKNQKTKTEKLTAKSTNNESSVSLTHEKSQYTIVRGTNTLGDLQFFPKPGQFSVNAELSSRPNKATATFKGKDVLSSKESMTVQEYKVNYGINENLAGGVTIEHYLSGKRELEYVEQKKTLNTKASGFADPTFSGTYRLATQNVSKVNTDLTFSFSPSLVKAEEGSEDKNGTRGRGAFLAQAKIEVGAKLPQVDVSGKFALGLEGEKEIKDLTSSNKYKIDSTTTIALGGAVRREFNDQFALKGGLDLTFVPEDKRTEAGKTYYTMDSFTRVGVLAEGQYTIVPQSVLAKLQIKLNTEGSRTLKLDEKLDVDSSSSQVFLLGADFLF